MKYLNKRFKKQPKGGWNKEGEPPRHTGPRSETHPPVRKASESQCPRLPPPDLPRPWPRGVRTRGAARRPAEAGVPGAAPERRGGPLSQQPPSPWSQGEEKGCPTALLVTRTPGPGRGLSPRVAAPLPAGRHILPPGQKVPRPHGTRVPEGDQPLFNLLCDPEGTRVLPTRDDRTLREGDNCKRATSSLSQWWLLGPWTQIPTQKPTENSICSRTSRSGCSAVHPDDHVCPLFTGNFPIQPSTGRKRREGEEGGKGPGRALGEKAQRGSTAPPHASPAPEAARREGSAERPGPPHHHPGSNRCRGAGLGRGAAAGNPGSAAPQGELGLWGGRVLKRLRLGSAFVQTQSSARVSRPVSSACASGEHTCDPRGPRCCCQILCKGGPAGWGALRASTPSTAPT